MDYALSILTAQGWELAEAREVPHEVYFAGWEDPPEDSDDELEKSTKCTFSKGSQTPESWLVNTSSEHVPVASRQRARALKRPLSPGRSTPHPTHRPARMSCPVLAHNTETIAQSGMQM